MCRCRRSYDALRREIGVPNHRISTILRIFTRRIECSIPDKPMASLFFGCEIMQDDLGAGGASEEGRDLNERVENEGLRV